MAEAQKTLVFETQTENSAPAAPDIGGIPTVVTPPLDTPAPDISKKTDVEYISKDDAPAKSERSSKAPKPEKTDKKPEATKPKKAERAPRLPKGPKPEKQVSGGGISSGNAGKDGTTPAATEPPPAPRDATRPGETESIVYIAHAELHPFKAHPFQVRDDESMKSLVESVKERGIDQPALVRPREGGGFELVSGHRRQHAAELAGFINVPCVVRNMTDDEAILAMTESNFNQRAEILPSERAKALQMQLEAIKHQGARGSEVGKRSNEVIAERNKMSIKNVQRYIALNNLVPELMQQVDDKRMKFTVAVELSYIKPKNQDYIAVAIDAQQSTPSGAQAQRIYPQIKLILVLPCKTQTRGWDKTDVKVYDNIKERCDKFVYTSDEYTRTCMFKRNRHLVDNSSVCICYLTEEKGGTAYTVKYALETSRRVINIA